MKKYLFTLSITFLLIGCSDGDEAQPEENNEVAEASNSSISTNDNSESTNDEEDALSEDQETQKDIDGYAWEVYTIEDVAVDEMINDRRDGKVVIIPEDAEVLENATIEEFSEGEKRPEWSTYMTELWGVTEGVFSEEYREAWRIAINAVHDEPESVVNLVEQAREVREADE